MIRLVWYKLVVMMCISILLLCGVWIWVDLIENGVLVVCVMVVVMVCVLFLVYMVGFFVKLDMVVFCF